jgi:hypothetical protein
MPEPWKSFFGEIDASLEEEVALHCLGGFVMNDAYGLDRLLDDVTRRDKAKRETGSNRRPWGYESALGLCKG